MHFREATPPHAPAPAQEPARRSLNRLAVVGLVFAFSGLSFTVLARGPWWLYALNGVAFAMNVITLRCPGARRC